MSQSINEIYSQIIAINNSYPEMAEITNSNTSNMSLLQLIYYIQAVQLSLNQQYWDNFKTDLQTIANNAPVASGAWWQDKMFKFQYSSDPDYGVIINEAPYFVPSYTNIDNSLNIIKYCAVTQNGKQVVIKVAKDDGSGNPTQLIEDELNSAKSYKDRIQPMGLAINVVSFPADNIKLNIEIYYNAQFVQSTVLANVKTAITNYLKSLKFDGAVYISKIEDAIQLVEGVNDVRIVQMQGKGTNTSYEVIDRVYPTLSGYCSFDDTNSTITMNIGN